MAGRRIFRLVALMGLVGAVGCQSWCAQHYPCPAAPACYQPTCCVPCQPGAGYAPAAAPAWNAPSAPCPSGCVTR